ncbi:MAG TPA: hypothetical protein VHW09_07315 [Bryobacteraceae bacterium]|jgi:hypothetical protein|nr:hypothetical protein [Bryobacteraceae bacterium]
MRLTIVLGIIYLAVLKLTHVGHRVPALRVQRASIVWGSVVPQNEESV